MRLMMTFPLTVSLLAAWIGLGGCEPSSSGHDSIHTWGYQLDQIIPESVVASPFDLVVLDYAKGGSEETEFGIAANLLWWVSGRNVA
jgi:hypothetical protein